MLPTLIILAIFSALTSGFQLPPGAHDNAHWRRPSALRCRLQEPGLAQGTLRASSGGITHIYFDLDDTLWPTAEVVASANADLAAWLLPRSAAAVDGKALQLLMKDVRRIHQRNSWMRASPLRPSPTKRCVALRSSCRCGRRGPTTSKRAHGTRRP